MWRIKREKATQTEKRNGPLKGGFTTGLLEGSIDPPHAPRKWQKRIREFWDRREMCYQTT